MKIIIAFPLLYFYDGTFYPNLAFQFFPEKQQSGMRIFADFASLPAKVIGEENKPFLIIVFQQHNPCGRHSLFIGSGQGHGIDFIDRRIKGFFPPF